MDCAQLTEEWRKKQHSIDDNIEGDNYDAYQQDIAELRPIEDVIFFKNCNINNLNAHK